MHFNTCALRLKNILLMVFWCVRHFESFFFFFKSIDRVFYCRPKSKWGRGFVLNISIKYFSRRGDSSVFWEKNGVTNICFFLLSTESSKVQENWYIITLDFGNIFLRIVVSNDKIKRSEFEYLLLFVHLFCNWSTSSHSQILTFIVV